MDRLQRQIRFLLEADKLKTIFRRNTLPIFLNESPRFRASETQIGIYMGLMQLSAALSSASRQSPALYDTRTNRRCETSPTSWPIHASRTSLTLIVSVVTRRASGVATWD